MPYYMRALLPAVFAIFSLNSADAIKCYSGSKFGDLIDATTEMDCDSGCFHLECGEQSVKGCIANNIDPCSEISKSCQSSQHVCTTCYKDNCNGDTVAKRDKRGVTNKMKKRSKKVFLRLLLGLSAIAVVGGCIFCAVRIGCSYCK